MDVERAKASPLGGPIAHGFLTLSLIPLLALTAGRGVLALDALIAPR